MKAEGRMRRAAGMIGERPTAYANAPIGTVVTAGKWVRWTKRMKAMFLDHLAATCNVSSAAAVIGVEPGSVYSLRRTDPAFAAAWTEALAAGYEMLETQLVGHALAGGGRTIVNGAVDRTGPIDVDLALKLLGTHRDAMLDRARGRRGPRRKVATMAETDEAILKKLESMARSKARS